MARRRKAPESEDTGRKSRKLVADDGPNSNGGPSPSNDPGAGEGCRRSSRTTRGQGGAVAQLEAVANKLSGKQQGGLPSVDETLENVPVNPMAPVKKQRSYVKRGRDPLVDMSVLPVVTAPTPVFTNASQDGRYGFQPPSSQAVHRSPTRQENETAPDSEVERLSMPTKEVGDSTTEAIVSQSQDNNGGNDIIIDEVSSDEDELRARRALHTPNAGAHRVQIVMSDESDSDSYLVLRQHHQKNKPIRPPDPASFNIERQKRPKPNTHSGNYPREHSQGRLSAQEPLQARMGTNLPVNTIGRIDLREHLKNQAYRGSTTHTNSREFSQRSRNESDQRLAYTTPPDTENDENRDAWYDVQDNKNDHDGNGARGGEEIFFGENDDCYQEENRSNDSNDEDCLGVEPKQRVPRNTRTHEATPTKLKFYFQFPGWPDVITSAKHGYRRIEHVKMGEGFPGRTSETLQVTTRCIADSLAKYETLGISIDKSIYRKYITSMAICVFKDSAAYRGRMKNIGRNIVKEFYSDAIKPDILEGHNSADEEEVIRTRVTQLLESEENQFHMTRDRNGKVCNFCHPAIAELAREFYYCDKADSLAKLYPNDFKVLPLGCVAMASACIVNCLDEWKTGFHRKIKFAGQDYRGVYHTMTRLINEVERDRGHAAKLYKFRAEVGNSVCAILRQDTGQSRSFKIRLD